MLRTDLRRQRLVVLGALLVLLLAWLSWPGPDRGGVSHAASECGPGDTHRATLTTAQGHTFTPCLSKVKVRVEIPRTRTSSLGCGPLFLQPCYEGKWRISSVSRSGGTQQVRYADGTTEQLYRLTFQQFRIHKDVTLTTIGGDGYTLTIRPDANAKLGGQGSNGETVYTDLWVTGTSSIALDFNLLGIGYTCHNPALVEDLGIASWLTVSTDGCGMVLDAAYIVTTGETGPLEGFYSVNLPNARITVQ